MSDKSTDSHGFQWGCMAVTRLTDLGKEGKVLGVKTPREAIQIRVTPSGLIRIYREGADREC